jgi:hypothetical protein
MGNSKYLSLPGNTSYRIELNGLDNGTFTFEMEEVIGDEVVDTKVFEDIPTSPSMKAEMTLTTLEDATPLSIDIDGDGEEDGELTGEEGEEEQEQTIEVSLKVTTGVIKEMEMNRSLKKQLLRDIEKIKSAINKEEYERAKRYTDLLIIKLQQQIKRNHQLEKTLERYLKMVQDNLRGLFRRIFMILA